MTFEPLTKSTSSALGSWPPSPYPYKSSSWIIQISLFFVFNFYHSIFNSSFSSIFLYHSYFFFIYVSLFFIFVSHSFILFSFLHPPFQMNLFHRYREKTLSGYSPCNNLAKNPDQSNFKNVWRFNLKTITNLIAFLGGEHRHVFRTNQTCL